MFGEYTVPVITTFLLFPFVALLVFIPYAFRSYRKYGQLGFLHSLVFYSFILYALALLFFVTLPLPRVVPNFCLRYYQAPQLIPLHFIEDLRREVEHLTFRNVVTNRVFLSAFFNVLFFVPLGFYLRYYFRLNIWVAGLCAFGVSLLLELTQLTGLWGIYPCPYRLFDVDDLLMNTSGGLLGYPIAALLRFLPRPEQVIAGGPERVSVARRAVAMAIDAAFVWVAPLIAYLGVFGALFIIYGYQLQTPYNGPIASLLQFILGLVNFVLVPLRWRGFTLGKFVVGIHAVGPGEQPVSNGMVLTLYATLFLPITLFSLLLEASNGGSVAAASTFGIVGVVLVNLLIVLITPNRATLGSLLARTQDVAASS